MSVSSAAFTYNAHEHRWTQRLEILKLLGFSDAREVYREKAFDKSVSLRRKM